MICNPQQGQRVQVWYRPDLRALMPLHGRIGVVEIVGRKRPRNHGVRVGPQLHVIPCGNLRPESVQSAKSAGLRRGATPRRVDYV